jgi:phosphoglycerol transferase
MNKLSQPSTRGRSIAAYLATLAICVGYMTYSFQLWNADINVPFLYDGDALLFLALTKGAIDHGWFLANPSVGAPVGLQMHDFPISEGLHYGIMRLIGTVLNSPGAAFNLYFLLTFPLTALTSLFVLRRFQVPYLIAMVASLLFAFHPHHFFRGQAHLFLASYYLLPCIVMVALWLYMGQLPFWARQGQADPADKRSSRLRWIASIVLCLLHASAGVYYAFLSCYLFVIAGLAAALKLNKLRPLYSAIVLVAVTTGGVLANVGHSILYNLEHGKNPEVAVRGPVEAEIYGMKITQLLMPIWDHRIERLANLRTKYEATMVSSGPVAVNESMGSGLGAAASIGFCFLLVLLLKGNSGNRPSLLYGLSVFNVTTLLLSTIGGFGSIFALLVSPKIRAYNRFSIFLAFFALFALALLFREFGDRLKSVAARAAFALLLVGLLALGLFDQTPRTIVPNYAHVQAQFKNDADFVAQIDSALPPESMVYQLPFTQFPEVVPPGRMIDYSHFRTYLHSDNLRWSYGQMRGRPTANREREMSAKPLDEQMVDLAALGFQGIWIDRLGYADNGADIEQRLASLLGVASIASADARFSFFDMSKYNQALQNRLSRVQWDQRKQEATWYR